jgi:5-(carboxyamino)imidazole ribonucleotide mutase
MVLGGTRVSWTWTSDGRAYFVAPLRRTMPTMNSQTPLVGIIMGSTSDFETMRHASVMLASFGVAHECRVVSAHRTPDLLFEYASGAASRGLKVIIAGAGGAAHLPGMCASKTTLQMPAGVPVATLAIGEAGAKNAALVAVSILALSDTTLSDKLAAFRAKQTADVLAMTLPPA